MPPFAEFALGAEVVKSEEFKDFAVKGGPIAMASNFGQYAYPQCKLI
jgi:hypothetical protein